MSAKIRAIEVEPQDALAIRELVPMAQIPKRMGEFLGELAAYLKKKKIAMTGPPFALYHGFGDDRIDMEVGFPVASPRSGEGRIKACTLPGGKVVTATHVGPYEELEATYRNIAQWMSENGLKPKELMWERYLTDPQAVKDPSKYVTELFWPVE